MTLFRLPVTITSPRPGICVASMNRMSPPAGVHASPVATPGELVRSARSGRCRGAPRTFSTVSRRRPAGGRLALGDSHDDVPADRTDLAFEAANAGLARVGIDDRVERRPG